MYHCWVLNTQTCQRFLTATYSFWQQRYEHILNPVANGTKNFLQLKFSSLCVACKYILIYSLPMKVKGRGEGLDWQLYKENGETQLSL